MRGWSPRRHCRPRLYPTSDGSGRVDRPIFGGLATRNPRLLFSFVGVLLFRFDERRLFSLLFQEPPRSPREEPAFSCLAPTLPSNREEPRSASASFARAQHAPPTPELWPAHRSHGTHHAATAIGARETFSEIVAHSPAERESGHPPSRQTRKSPPRPTCRRPGICRGEPPYFFRVLS